MEARRSPTSPSNTCTLFPVILTCVMPVVIAMRTSSSAHAEDPEVMAKLTASSRLMADIRSNIWHERLLVANQC